MPSRESSTATPTTEPPFDVEAFLAALHASNQERDTDPIDPPPISVRRQARQRNRYEAILARVAILAALAVVAGLWYLGGMYTLAFLKSRATAIDDWGALAWFIPIAITALEIGVFAARTRIPALWLVWAGVLIFDIFTTAAGVLAAIAGIVLTGTNPSAWLLAGIFGTALALGQNQRLAR